MAKLTRVFQKLFGSTAPAGKIGRFGSINAGAPHATTDPADMQSLPNFNDGWTSAVIGQNSPAIQDMNALHFLTFRQIAYLLQQGIAEYDAETEYCVGSMVNSDGTVYISCVDGNIGHTPDSVGQYWMMASDLGYNWLLNGDTRYYQRGAGPFNADSDYMPMAADRYFLRPNLHPTNVPTISNSVEQLPANGKSKNVIKISGSGASSTTPLYLGYRIMKHQTPDIRGKTMIFSCLLYNNTGADIVPVFVARTTKFDTFWAGTFNATEDGCWNAPTRVNMQSCSNGQWTRVYATLDLSLLDVEEDILKGLQLEVEIPASATTAGKNIYITQLQLNVGKILQEFRIKNKTHDEEFEELQEYYEKTFDADIAPATNESNSSPDCIISSVANSVSSIVRLKKNKRLFVGNGRNPVTIYKPTSGIGNATGTGGFSISLDIPYESQFTGHSFAVISTSTLPVRTTVLFNYTSEGEARNAITGGGF